jgi:hypothetical protein
MKNKLFLIVGISTVLYIAALSGCQSISNKREANKINNTLLEDLDSLLEYIK